MLSLKVLLDVRKAYEIAFASRDADILEIVERLSDRDLELSNHVFVATLGDRRLQISLLEEGSPAAFIKKVGYPLQQSLLHVHVNFEDLMLEECKHFLNIWVINPSAVSAVAEVIRQFNEATRDKYGEVM